MGLPDTEGTTVLRVHTRSSTKKKKKIVRNLDRNPRIRIRQDPDSSDSHHSDESDQAQPRVSLENGVVPERIPEDVSKEVGIELENIPSLAK